jgi:hypothetical protein
MPQRRRVMSQTDSRWTVRRTVGGLPSRGLGFAAGTVIVGFISTRRKSAGTYLPPSISVFPCQYHSTTAPYSFIHLPPTLYNVFLPVLQFSPVSIIPPLLHTHSATTNDI